MINEETANLAWSSQYGLALSVDVSKTTATVSVETADHEGIDAHCLRSPCFGGYVNGGNAYA